MEDVQGCFERGCGVGVAGAEELAVRKRRMVTGDGVGRFRIGFGEEVGGVLSGAMDGGA